MEFAETAPAGIPGLLTQEEMECLGGDTVYPKVNLGREEVYHHPGRLGTEFFNATDSTWEFPFGQKLHNRDGHEVLEAGPQVVRKTSDGNGFFPIIAAKEVNVHFSRLSEQVMREVRILKKQLQRIEPDATVELSGTDLHLKFPGVFEFDFASNNFGCRFTKLLRLTVQDKREHLRARLSHILKDPVLGASLDIDNLNEKEIDEWDLGSLETIKILKQTKKSVSFSHANRSYEGKVVKQLLKNQVILKVLGSFYLLEKLFTKENQVQFEWNLRPTQQLSSSVTRVYNGTSKDRTFHSDGKLRKYPLVDGDLKRYIIPEQISVVESGGDRARLTHDAKAFTERTASINGTLREVVVEYQFEGPQPKTKSVTLTAVSADGAKASISLPVTFFGRDDSGKKISYLVASNGELECTLSSHQRSLVLKDGQTFTGVGPQGSLPYLEIKLMNFDEDEDL